VFSHTKTHVFWLRDHFQIIFSKWTLLTLERRNVNAWGIFSVQFVAIFFKFWNFEELQHPLNHYNWSDILHGTFLNPSMLNWKHYEDWIQLVSKQTAYHCKHFTFDSSLTIKKCIFLIGIFIISYEQDRAAVFSSILNIFS
jgi:hypothetical protein